MTLLTIKDFCAGRDWPTEGGLRWLIFNAKENGFDRVLRRVGRRVLIDDQEFDEWIEDTNPRRQGKPETPDLQDLIVQTPTIKAKKLELENANLKAENERLKTALRAIRIQILKTPID